MRVLSLEEQVRRAIEKELDMPMRPPKHVASSSFLASSPQAHARRPRQAHHDTWALDSGDSEFESDDDDGIPQSMAMHSPGNHSAFLATPHRGSWAPSTSAARYASTRRTAQPRSHARPTLSERAQAQLNISRLAGADDADETVRGGPGVPPPPPPTTSSNYPGLYTRRPSPVQSTYKPAPSPRHGSRQSSGETVVNNDAYEADPIKKPSKYAHLPSFGVPLDAQWADRQLHTLAECIQFMDKEIQQLKQRKGVSDELVQISGRLDELESRVAEHSVMLADLATRPLTAEHILKPQQPSPPPSVSGSPQPESQPYPHLRTASPSPPSPPPPTTSTAHGIDAVMQRMYSELQHLSRAIRDMSSHSNPEAVPAKPYTPPPPRAASPPADIPHSPTVSLEPLPTQERYEQICKSVAEALGLASPLPSSASSSRKEKIRANLRQREADDAATESLLRRLHHTRSPLLSMSEVRMLEHLFKQHTREFLHQKQLYCELADELKCMEPSMDATKRRILAEHVHESIDSLEAEATRINGLHAHLIRHGRAPPFSSV